MRRTSTHGFFRNLPAAGLFLLPLLPAPHAAAQVQAGPSSAYKVLTTANAVHSLNPELASRVWVHLRATVTFNNPNDQVLFVQDASGGVYVQAKPLEPVTAGDIVTIDGRAHGSYRTEVSHDAVVRLVGKNGKASATPADYDKLASGDVDCRLVTVQGTVRSAVVEQHPFGSSTLHLDLGMPGGEVEVYVQRYERLDTLSLIGAQVQITGATGGSFDAKDQLTGLLIYVEDSTGIKVLKPPPLGITEVPRVDINSVFRTLRYTDMSARIRVRGAVTEYRKGEYVVLEYDGKSIYAQTRETRDIHVGDVVDAIGYAGSGLYAPSLREVVLLETGLHEAIAPIPVTYEQAISGLYTENLVSIEGKLVGSLVSQDSTALTLDIDGHIVRAVMAGAGRLPAIPNNAIVRVRGICRVFASGPWHLPGSFRIDIRTPADVRVVHPPSWWTVKHTLALLAGLLFIAIGIAVWALVLRRRVVDQSDQLKRAALLAQKRSEILERVSNNEPMSAVLTMICAAVESLLPGASCRFAFHAAAAAHQPPETAPVVCRTELLGGDGTSVGEITVCCDRTLPMQDEVFRALRELATIAMRQSLLHEGLIHHSTHDALTDLPNRRLCENRLTAAIDDAASHSQTLAVIYIDVNRFKQINDRYGHGIGDIYLQAIAARLGAELRSTDTLARIGGDEFMVVLPRTSLFDAEAVIKRLGNCFDSPFSLDGNRIEGTASFGLACYPQHGLTREELERHADHCMYVAKHHGNGQPGKPALPVVTPHELEVALEKGRFRLAYQPQFAPDGHLTGLEALIRLEDPILGVLAPDAFIPAAENSDAILGMGKWVLRSALCDAVLWGLGDQPQVRIAINVSSRQVEQSTFAEMVLDCVEESGLAPGQLELELTERTLLSHSDEVGRQLHRLHNAGVRIALDDFGTGYSSLSLLHTLPIDTIKLDRSFVKAIDSETRVLPVVQAIISMARRLNMRIVAEGLEHPEAVTALLRMGRMDFQGYLFSRPVAADKVGALLGAWLGGVDIPQPDAAERRKRYPTHAVPFPGVR